MLHLHGKLSIIEVQTFLPKAACFMLFLFFIYSFKKLAEHCFLVCIRMRSCVKLCPIGLLVKFLPENYPLCNTKALVER